jgi:hypothetical protein
VYLKVSLDSLEYLIKVSLESLSQPGQLSVSQSQPGELSVPQSQPGQLRVPQVSLSLESLVYLKVSLESLEYLKVSLDSLVYLKHAWFDATFPKRQLTDFSHINLQVPPTYTHMQTTGP